MLPLPHILLAVSSNYLFLVETLVRSLVKFGKLDFFADLVVLNADKLIRIDEFKYISRYCDVSYSIKRHEDHYPPRWFIKPKSDVCVFLDFDILICSSIKPLVDICVKEEKFCAVPAIKSSIGLEEWHRLFALCNVKFPHKMIKTQDGSISPYYVNYGMLAMPAKFVNSIKEVILKNVEIVKRFTSQPYFIGQISLAISLAQTDTPTLILPKRFNYTDNLDDNVEKEELDNIVFYHMLELKKYIKCVSDIKKLTFKYKSREKIKDLLLNAHHDIKIL